MRRLTALSVLSYLFGLILLLNGCATQRATLKTFVEPSIQPGSIQSVAILPMRNVRLLPDESREINRGVSEAFHRQNPSVAIVGPTKSTSLLNQAGLADRYSDFLRDYATSGIPNVTILKEIGDALEVDAILQGEVFDIRQADGAFGGWRGHVSVTVRYVLLSTDRGDVLWEAIANAKKTTATTVEPAPPLYEAISVAQEKILTGLPELGERIGHEEGEWYRVFPYPENKVVHTVYSLCKEQYGLKSWTKAEGLIETDWITEKYSRSDRPSGLIDKMREYGSSSSPRESKWSGIRYKYLVFITGISDVETRVEVQTKLEAYNYWYKRWRRWDSNGTLEHLLLSEVGKHLKGS
jgi:hypothetical protein